VCFLAFSFKKVVKDWFLDLCLEWKYKRIRCTMYLGRQNFNLKVVLMVDERDDEKFRGFKSGQKLFSKCVFGMICIWVLLACIS
jgi:hypothetical protein